MKRKLEVRPPQARGLARPLAPHERRGFHQSGFRVKGSSSGVEHERTDTIADGLATRSPIPEALADMMGLIEDALLVADSSMIIGMRLLHSHAGLVAEPSAAAGVAAVVESPDRFRGSDVGTTICGGNVAEDHMRRWLGVG